MCVLISNFLFVLGRKIGCDSSVRKVK
jgi:hypothetical protein